MKNAISLAKNVSTISLRDVSCQDQPLKQEQYLRLIKKISPLFCSDLCASLNHRWSEKHIYLPWQTQQLYRHQQILCKEYSPIQTQRNCMRPLICRPSNKELTVGGPVALGKVHLIWQGGMKILKLEAWNFSCPPPSLEVQFVRSPPSYWFWSIQIFGAPLLGV